MAEESSSRMKMQEVEFAVATALWPRKHIWILHQIKLPYSIKQMMICTHTRIYTDSPTSTVHYAEMSCQDLMTVSWTG